jgi:hypothetical protein
MRTSTRRRQPPRIRITLVLGLGVILGVTLGVTPAADEALAAKKPKLTARVSGKKFKANIRASISGAYTTAGVILNGTFQRIRLSGGTVRTFTIVCGDIDIATATLPVTVDCGGAYTDNTFTGPVPPANPKAWGGDEGLAVTFTTFNGARVTGTFEGSLPPGDTNPGDPAATFEKGKFAVLLAGGGT